MEKAEREDCVKLFYSTMAELNKVSEQQANGLLRIAIIAAESARSLAASNTVEGAGASAAQLSELAEQLKRSAEKINEQSHKGANLQVADGGEAGQSQVSKETFCERVEASLNVAIQNSVTLQQQMNILGQAMLAQAAALLFSVAGAGLANADGPDA